MLNLRLRGVSLCSQTKILEGLTNHSEFSFDAVFNVLSPKSSTPTLEKCFPWKRILKGGSMHIVCSMFILPRHSFEMHDGHSRLKCIVVEFVDVRTTGSLLGK
jgi:hypothetical protein